MTERVQEGSPDLFDRIRESCRRVAQRARFVKIQDHGIAEYASQLAALNAPPPTLDREHHFTGTDEETVAFFVTLDAVNFGSGYFPHLRKRPGMSGYFTIASRLADRFHRDGPLSAEELRSLDREACARLFGQSSATGPIAELMDLFCLSLRDLGTWLEHNFRGSFLGPIAQADGSAARLIGLLAEMPLFRDQADYQGSPVLFYKRAQILISDLALAFSGRGPGRFRDLDRLTIFADNLVPHVLRLDGVLSYDEGLLRRIEAEEEIASGSDEEIEVRACAVDAVERIVESLRADGRSVRPRDIDILLWNRGQSPRYKRGAARHRTRTVFY